MPFLFMIKLVGQGVILRDFILFLTFIWNAINLYYIDQEI